MVRYPASVLLVALVIVAGCSGFSPTTSPVSEEVISSPNSTETELPNATADPLAREKITVEGGNLSFDVGRVFRRVVQLHGLELESMPNVTVHVRDRSSVSLDQLYEPSRFEQSMGVEPVAEETAIAGFAGADGESIWIYTDVITDPVAREAVLAHEFAHIVQFATSARETIRRNLNGRQTQINRVETGLFEGAATYVENTYANRFLQGGQQFTDWQTAREGRSVFGRFIVAPYVFGTNYVTRTIDSPQSLPTLYVDPPQTTEQLIHVNRARPVPFDVRTSTTGNWHRVSTRVKGELFTRLILEQHLTVSRAAEAAAGWGNDRLVTVSDGAERGHIWAIRHDTPGDADDFATAIRTFLDRHGSVQGDRWVDGETQFRLERVDDETVVLLVGGAAFLDATSIHGENSTVIVQTDDT